jgi:hypothetical protein
MTPSKRLERIERNNEAIQAAVLALAQSVEKFVQTSNARMESVAASFLLTDERLRASVM